MPSTLKQVVDRVKAAKTAIGNAITTKGGTVSQGDGLEEFAADIVTIPRGEPDVNSKVPKNIPLLKNWNFSKNWSTKTWT